MSETLKRADDQPVARSPRSDAGKSMLRAYAGKSRSRAEFYALESGIRDIEDESALAAEIGPCPSCDHPYCPCSCHEATSEAARPSRAAETGLRATGKCGCNCVCHGDEGPDWPGPCAACCEPGMNCDCGRALASRAAEPLDVLRATAQAMVRSMENWLESFTNGTDEDRTAIRQWSRALRLLLAAPHEAVPEREEKP